MHPAEMDPDSPAGGGVVALAAGATPGCRALLTASDAAALNAQIRAEGFWTINQVRDIIQTNVPKESMDYSSESHSVDPEIMIQIDLRTNYPIFIAGDNVYTREELCEVYPFAELKQTPEAIFAQQEIGVFVSTAAPDAAGAPAPLYIARDVGDAEEMTPVTELVRRAVRGGASEGASGWNRAALVRTKIYFGRSKWADFTKFLGMVRGLRSFVAPLVLGYEPKDGDVMRALPFIFGGGAAAPLMIGHAESEEAARREAEMRAREAAMARREAALKRAQEMFYASLGLNPADLQAFDVEEAPEAVEVIEVADDAGVAEVVEDVGTSAVTVGADTGGEQSVDAFLAELLAD